MPRVCLFGGVSIRRDDNVISCNLGDRANELFAYLSLYEGVAHRREKLAELVWPDKAEQRSRSCLNTTIWRIQSLLDSAGLKTDIVLRRAAQAAIKLEFSSKVHVDCRSLAENVRQCELAVRNRGKLSGDERHALRTETDQYGGAFLEGHDGEWVLRERERLHCLYIRGLSLLMHDLTREGRYEEALECGRSILASDEMREVVQREVMWLYVMNGQRSEAITQYRRFRKRLKEELDIEPMSETATLYQHILGKNGRMPLPPQLGGESTPDMATVRNLLHQCERERASIYSALVRSTSSEN